MIVGLQYILDTEEKRIEGYGCFCYLILMNPTFISPILYCPQFALFTISQPKKKKPSPDFIVNTVTRNPTRAKDILFFDACLSVRPLPFQ